MNESESKIILEGAESDYFRETSPEDLLSSEVLLSLYDIKDLAERARIRALLILAAKDKHIEREVKEVLKAYDAADVKLQHDYQKSQSLTTMFSFVKEHQQLDCGCWIADDNGVRMQKPSGEITFATKTPILPVALLENVSTGTEKVKLLYLKNGSARTLICDRQIAANQSKIVQLADKGIEVTSETAKLLVRYISDCINYNVETLPYAKAYSQLGWSNSGFIPYSEDAVLDAEDENRILFGAVAPHGSLENWLSMTHDLRENILIRLTMAASFASVLIKKVGGLPFVCHIWGGTGTGKTVALKVAMSIWGNPEMGKLTRTMNMTVNAMMSTAAFLNDLPFAGDELQTIKDASGDYDRLIMRVCEGVDRGRMDSNGKAKEMRKWNCAFIFTGEEPCTHDSSGGGVKNRVIQMEVTKPLCVSHSGNEAVSIVEENYGHAGKVFIEHLETVDDLKEQFRGIYNKILAKTDTTEKQAIPMALMLLADKLACECLYTDETPLQVEDSIPYLCSADDIDTSERAYEWFCDFVARNEVRFKSTSLENHGERWGKIEPDYVLINKQVLCGELRKAGFNFDAIKKKWKTKGYVIMQSGKYSSRTCVDGGEVSRYVKMAKPSKDDELDEVDYNDVPF